MLSPSPFEQQLAATWAAARVDGRGGGRGQRIARRRRLFRLVRSGR